ncbi:MAG: twin-arginine translocase TatA/TatE family subunit [Symbiobacteriia bacterium]
MGFLREIGPLEWVVLLIILLLIMGPKRLPDMARGLARGIRGFKSELHGDGEDAATQAKKDE